MPAAAQATERCRKRIVVVEDTSQIELLDIPQVAGFCTVAEDGTVSYYKKEAALES